MSALDFAGMLRVGLCRLGLRPDEFWNLTPAELALMLGVEGGDGTMTRQRLEALAARFPDGGREVGGRGSGRHAPAPAGDMAAAPDGAAMMVAPDGAAEMDATDQGAGDEQGRVRTG